MQTLIAVLLLTTIVACRAGEAPAVAEGAQFHAALLEAAAGYAKYERVTDMSRWAPLMCMMPPPIPASYSKSKEADTHGQKLYFLFAKDPRAYLALGVEKLPGILTFPPASELKSGPTEQIIVKESWKPREVDGKEELAKAEMDLKRDSGMKGFSHYSRKDGKIFHAESKAGLFIMMKLDAKTPGTDEGWVYGTLSADGKNVTAAGRIGSCMKCHQEAPHGRLFGLPETKK